MYGEEEEKITLDKNTFKTLASDTRVGILKSLTVRRKTLSELSKEYGMSVSTVKEHLDKLSNAGLIEQKDDGHKWKYYELTRKGKGVLNPGEKKIWVLLSVSAIAALSIGFDAFTGFFGKLFAGAQTFEAADGLLNVHMMTETGQKIGETAGNVVAQTAFALPWVHIGLMAAFLALMGFSILRMVRFRKNLI